MVKKPPGAGWSPAGWRPRRPWSGSVRDFVLGTRIITGTGRHLRFGGEVMKTLPDTISRLMAEATVVWVCSLKSDESVTATTRATLSLRREISLQEAMNEIAQWQLQPFTH